jgi:predicted flavoprotein YhiN
MIAAARAAERGCRTLLIEKNSVLGRKLIITGGGRCNVTTAVYDRHLLVARYGENGRFLHSLFARFSPEDTRGLLRRFGLETKVEAEHRVFPVTDDARSVRTVLEDYMDLAGVTVRAGTSVVRLLLEEGTVVGVVTHRGETIRGGTYILALGGSSRPETGSTGDALPWLRELGLPVREVESSLVPIRSPDRWVRELQGLALPDAGFHVEVVPRHGGPGAAGHAGGAGSAGSAGGGGGAGSAGADGAAGGASSAGSAGSAGRAASTGAGTTGANAPDPGDRSAWGNARRVLSRRGKLLFTHFGLSGPVVLNAAAEVREHARTSVVRLVVDPLPGTPPEEVDARLLAAARTDGRRQVKRALSDLVAPRLAEAVCLLAGVDGTRRLSELARADRRRITDTVKGLPCGYGGLMGQEKAVVSSGGLHPSAVDFRTLRLHAYPNVAVLGDMLDFDRQSGGFSLQICWASGWVAAEGCDPIWTQ